MTAARSPEHALEHLSALSTDIRTAIVLDAAGERLAGSEALAAPARVLLAATESPAVEVTSARGSVFAMRSARHAIVLVAVRSALASVMLYDLRTVLAELGDGAGG